MNAPHSLKERLQLRQAVIRSIRGFFAEEDVLEVETPALGVCPGLDSHVHSLGGISTPLGHRFLMTSPEFFMKRLLAAGIGDIYQLARAYRAEELGPLHEPEFTLLEWYRLGVDWMGLMDDTERLLRQVAALSQTSTPCLQIWRDGSLRQIDVSQPFLRIPVRDAYQRWAQVSDAVDLAASDEARFFQLWVDQVEPGLAELAEPVFLTHYPQTQAALARLCQDDPSTAERFELIVGGVELANGYGELTDAKEQRRRFSAELQRRNAQGEPQYPLDERFLATLPQMPAAAGNALGVDRLVQMVGGFHRIQDAVAFPASDC